MSPNSSNGPYQRTKNNPTPTTPVHLKPKLGPAALQLDLPKMEIPYVPDRYGAPLNTCGPKLTLKYEKDRKRRQQGTGKRIGEKDDKKFDPNAIRHFNFDVTIGSNQSPPDELVTQPENEGPVSAFCLLIIHLLGAVNYL